MTRIPSKVTRADIEAEIERLIALLDQLDGDPDLEPWLAENGFNITDDREGHDVLDEGEDLREDDEDDGTTEPSLGSPEIPPTRLMRGGLHGWHVEQGLQTRWADGGHHEREEEDDAEPSLGWATLKGMSDVFPVDRSRE